MSDVPNCKYCGGSGEYCSGDSYPETCSWCRGSGKYDKALFDAAEAMFLRPPYRPEAMELEASAEQADRPTVVTDRCRDAQ